MAMNPDLLNHNAAIAAGFRDTNDGTAVDNAARAYGYANAQEAARALGFNSVAEAADRYFRANTPGFDQAGYESYSPNDLYEMAKGTRFESSSPQQIYQGLVKGDAWSHLDPSMEGYDALKQFALRSPEQNAEALRLDNERRIAQDKAKFKPGKFIASLAGGLSGAALGAGALGLLGSAAAPAGTGLSAGGTTAGTAAAAPTSASSGGFFGNLSSSLGSLVSPSVAKGATLGGIKGALSGDGLSGALKGATIGGLTGGVGDYVGNYVMGGGLNDTIFSKLIGTTPGAALTGGLQGPTQSPGSGILGLISKSGGMGSLGSYAGALGDIYSTYNASKTQDKVAKQLLESQGRAEAAYNPYLQTGTAANQQLSDRLSAGFNPGDLTQDPGYQFRLSEAQKAADRANVARGGFYSGQALKESQNIAQGVADQTYQDAYNRWLTQNQQLAGQSSQGLQTAGALSDVYTNQGNINANKSVAKNNILSGALSTLVGSLDKNRRVVGRNYDGTPIYA